MPWSLGIQARDNLQIHSELFWRKASSLFCDGTIFITIARAISSLISNLLNLRDCEGTATKRIDPISGSSMSKAVEGPRKTQ